MKHQTTKKLLAFIITVMVFSALPQLASAQKNNPCPPGYKLVCINRGTICTCVHKGNGKNMISAASQESMVASFEIEHPTIISIKIYDATGRLVKTFADTRVLQGEYQIEWDRKDEQGNAVYTGIYFLQFNAVDKTETKKLSVAR